MLEITRFFDRTTSTLTYVIYDPHTKDSVIIDPVLDFDPVTTSITTKSLKPVLDFVTHNNLSVHMVVDTHVHADHATGAHHVKNLLQTKSGIGEHFRISQKYFSDIYDIDIDNYEPAYDVFFSHNEPFHCGSISLVPLYTPGHTPSCYSYVVDNAIFVGDAIFEPHLGCGRTDFPGGSAKALYSSVTKNIYRQNDDVIVYVGHDYPKDQADPSEPHTILEQKRDNIIISHGVDEESFITQREKRDVSLSLPRLYPYVMQINILGGQLPFYSRGQKPYLKLPLSME